MNIDVGICTFRRSSLFDTLETISAQRLPDNVHVNVIIADNDEQSVIKDEVLARCGELGLSVQYVFAPKFNISIARNACMDAASGNFLLFIDDDELAKFDWIDRFLAAHGETDAGVIFGQTLAIYPSDAPEWMISNQAHSNLPSQRNGIVETGFSGNVLIDLSNPVLQTLRFDEAFGRTGGEDVDFFFRAHRAGVKLAISNDAVVEEPVTRSRMSLRWLLLRRYTVGAIYGHCVLDGEDRSRLYLMSTAALKCIYCLARSAISVFSKERATFWIMRGAMHAGVVSGSLSQPSRQAYGGTKSELEK